VAVAAVRLAGFVGRPRPGSVIRSSALRLGGVFNTITRPSVSRWRRARHGVTRRGHLVCTTGSRPERLEPVAGGDIPATDNRRLAREVLQLCAVERTVKGDVNFSRTGA